jgi:hypothetical protein
VGPKAGVAGLCVPGELLKGAAQELRAEAEDAAEGEEDALETEIGFSGLSGVTIVGC